MHRLLFALVLTCACSGCPGSSSPEPQPPAPGNQPPAGEPTDTPPAPTPAEPAADLPDQSQPCAEGACAEGLTCVEYYGIAGPQGPKFTSCEIPCADDPAICPAGQQCVTVADGPGQVCRAQ